MICIKISLEIQLNSLPKFDFELDVEDSDLRDDSAKARLVENGDGVAPA